jgi:hypothetical protein
VILALTVSFEILVCSSQNVTIISSAREVQCLFGLTMLCNLLSAWATFLIFATIYTFLLLTQVLVAHHTSLVVDIYLLKIVPKTTGFLLTYSWQKIMVSCSVFLLIMTGPAYILLSQMLQQFTASVTLCTWTCHGPDDSIWTCQKINSRYAFLPL